MLTRNRVDNVFFIVLETLNRPCTDIRVILYTSGTHWYAEVAVYGAVPDWMGLAISHRLIYYEDRGADNEVEALRHLLRLTSENINEIRSRAGRDVELEEFLV